MSTHPLVINFVPDPTPFDPHWLTFIPEEYPLEVTVEEATTVMNALFETSSCLEAVMTEEVEITEEELVAAILLIDLDACNRLLSGNYTNRCKIIRSHPNEPYRLYAGVDVGGTRVSTARVSEEVILTVSVIDAEHVTLTYPVVSDQKASWMNGRGPILRANGNTLYWKGKYTGTIRTSFMTTYDLATIHIPGIPNQNKRIRGKKQECSLWAFYADRVWEDTISPPPDDPFASDKYLAAVCGWKEEGSSTEFEEEEEEPLPEEPPEPDDPCLLTVLDAYQTSYRPGMQLFDDDKCCGEVPKLLGDCMDLRVGSVPAKGLSDEVKARIAGMTEYCYMGLCHKIGSVEFVAVGPDPEDPKGCGDVIHRKVVPDPNCCDEVEPLVEHSDNPNEISSNGRVRMCVLGGAGRLTWAVGGGLWFDNGSTTMTTTARCLHVNAPNDFCLRSVINVADGCSELTMELIRPDAVPLSLDEPTGPVSPGSTLVMQASGGVGPYQWTGDDSLTLIWGQGSAQAGFAVSASFCGTADITVTDSCVELASQVVQSTAGSWETILAANGRCSSPIAGPWIEDGIYYLAQNGKYKATARIMSGGDGVTNQPCSAVNPYNCQSYQATEFCANGNLIIPVIWSCVEQDLWEQMSGYWRRTQITCTPQSMCKITTITEYTNDKTTCRENKKIFAVNVSSHVMVLLSEWKC